MISDDPLTPEDAHILFGLAQSNYDLALDGVEGAPGRPAFEDLGRFGHNLGLWVADAWTEVSVTEFLVRVARGAELPIYPITQAHPTSSASDMVGLWKKHLRISRDTPFPWIPLHVLGPYLVIGHFAPSCKDFAGLPPDLCIRTVMSQDDYQQCLEAGFALLDAPNTDTPLLPLMQECATAADWILAMRRHTGEEFDYELAREQIEKEHSYALVEACRRQGTLILPTDGIVMGEESMKALPREVALREPALCYLVCGYTLYVFTPRPEEIFRVQDELNTGNQGTPGLRLIGVYADETVVRAILERNARVLQDLTARGSDRDALPGAASVVLDPAKLANPPAVDLQSNPSLFVEWLLYRAVTLQASDIHLEMVDTEARARLRLNGSLIESAKFDGTFLAPVLNTIKIACRLPLVEKRRVLDGTFRLVLGDRQLDARVSLIPHMKEQTCVMRINSRGAQRATVESLNMSERNHALLMEATSVRTGIVFITGPTGSGKTTTLYAFLNHLNTVGVNIVTIEDPIEYILPGTKQFQINRPAGLDYGAFISGILRHDPNIALIGEIRDPETAKKAIELSHTGHLVFTTLHTNDAAGVVPRMVGLGVEPSQLAGAVVLIQAQRLVRTLCKHCSHRRPLIPFEAGMFERTGMEPPAVVRENNPKGCRVCQGTGFVGRRAIMEIMPGFPEFLDAVVRKAPGTELTAIQENYGFRNLYEEGLAMVGQGITTFAEAAGWKRAFCDFKGSRFAKPSARVLRLNQTPAAPAPAAMVA